MTVMGNEVDERIVAEAFRRAQLSGRAVPVLADFPSTVSRDSVESLYLPHIDAELARRTGPVNHSRPSLATFPGRQCRGDDGDEEDASPITWGGDGIAAMLVLEEFHM